MIATLFHALATRTGRTQFGHVMQSTDNETNQTAAIVAALVAEVRQLVKTPDRLAYTIDDAADALGISRRAVEGLILRGDIRSRKAGRVVLIARDELLRFLRVAK